MSILRGFLSLTTAASGEGGEGEGIGRGRPTGGLTGRERGDRAATAASDRQGAGAPTGERARPLGSRAATAPVMWRGGGVLFFAHRKRTSEAAAHEAAPDAHRTLRKHTTGQTEKNTRCEKNQRGIFFGQTGQTEFAQLCCEKIFVFVFPNLFFKSFHSSVCPVCPMGITGG